MKKNAPSLLVVVAIAAFTLQLDQRNNVSAQRPAPIDVTAERNVDFKVTPPRKAAPVAAKQWNVNNTDQISFATPYELYNKSTQIGYDKRTFGVDLGWVGHSGGHFEFRRRSPSRGRRDHRPGPIADNENVAIYNTMTGRYLEYYDRGGVRAEITWNSTPAYEWQIQDQSASGGRVHFALFNVRASKYLVHRVWDYGINLGWLDIGPPKPESFSLALTPQQVIQGWVPYLGTFGQNTRGNLLTVQNASQSATLMFVKPIPGNGTPNCSDPNATVRVGPRAMMTADQMQTLYASASPRLPITFLACLTAPTLQPIGPTFLSITYKIDP